MATLVYLPKTDICLDLKVRWRTQHLGLRPAAAPLLWKQHAPPTPTGAAAAAASGSPTAPISPPMASAYYYMRRRRVRHCPPLSDRGRSHW